MSAVPRFEDLTPEQLTSYRKKFDAIDLNHDGVIELREMVAISRVFGYTLSMFELREIFGKRDRDDSGTISFEEFVRAMLKRREKNAKLAPIRGKFKKWDYKGQGYITVDEAYPILSKELGFDLNKTEGIIDMFDKNRDYKLSIHEFAPFDTKVQQLKADIMKGFKEFDVDGDGLVTINEMKNAMCPKGFSDEEVQNMFAKYDVNGDGALDFQEFAKFWDVPLYK